MSIIYSSPVTTWTLRVSFIEAVDRPTSIDDEGLSRDETGVGAAQEHDRTDDLVWLSHPACRRSSLDLVHIDRAAVDVVVDDFGSRPTRHDAIDSHAKWRPLGCERLGQVNHAGLACRVRKALRKRQNAIHRTECDDPAASLREHVFPGFPDTQEGAGEVGCDDEVPIVQ